jgi:putative DNA primase/helicase
LSADYAHLPIGVHRFRHYCKENSTTKPLKVTVTGEGFVWYCHRCHETGPLSEDGNSRRRPMIVSPHTMRDTLSDFGHELWRQCRTLSATAVDYLQARHCVVPPGDGHLRWHPELKHPSGYIGPALVALVTSTLTDEPLSLHRTWILPSGKKADVDPSRLLLKDHRKAGGVIRLWPNEAVTSSLSIAEGIETALCAAHGATPIWSCIDAGNMGKFPVIAGIESLMIFADHDEVGLHAANTCAARWASVAEVIIVRPETPGTDMADAVATA